MGSFQVLQQYLGLLSGEGSYTVKVPLKRRPCRKNRRHAGKDD